MTAMAGTGATTEARRTTAATTVPITAPGTTTRRRGSWSTTARRPLGARRPRQPAPGGDRHRHHRRPDPAPLSHAPGGAHGPPAGHPRVAGCVCGRRVRRGTGAGAAAGIQLAGLSPFSCLLEPPMYSRDARIASYDPELAQAIADEARRQEDHVELIASENYASPRVLEAQGSVLTNKYAEGYPHKRYYGGCEYVDVAEQLAI